jgi:uncharacterized protein
MMPRSEAPAMVEANVTNLNLVKHMMAAEAIMRRLAEHFGSDVEKWGLTGLLHDIDWDVTGDDIQRHSAVAAEILTKAGVEEDIVYCVKVHNDAHGLPRLSLMDKALFAVDPLTGLVTAAALIRPEKKLDIVTVDFIVRRFGQKAFARGANREAILTCSELGLSLEEFVGLGLEAMQGIAPELGL